MIPTLSVQGKQDHFWILIRVTRWWWLVWVQVFDPVTFEQKASHNEHLTTKTKQCPPGEKIEPNIILSIYPLRTICSGFSCQNLCWVSLSHSLTRRASPFCGLFLPKEYPKGKTKTNSRFTGQSQSQDLPSMSIALTLLFHVIPIVCCPPMSSMSSQQGGASRGRADHLRDPRSGYSISSRPRCSLSSLTGPRHLWWWPCPPASGSCPFPAECSPSHTLQSRGIVSLTDVYTLSWNLLAEITIDSS